MNDWDLEDIWDYFLSAPWWKKILLVLAAILAVLLVLAMWSGVGIIVAPAVLLYLYLTDRI